MNISSNKIEIPSSSTFEGHTDKVNSVIYFPSFFKLVSCSDDKTIQIWDIRTSNCEKIIEKHSEVKQLLKWDEEKGTFLSCSDVGNAFYSSLKDESISAQRIFKIPSFWKEEDYKIAKLNDDEVLCSCYDDDLDSELDCRLCVVSLSDTKKKIENISIKLIKHDNEDYSNLMFEEKSILFENCIYVSFTKETWGSDVIGLVNLSTKEFEKVFESDDNDDVFSTVSVYLNSKNEECLVLGENFKDLLFYNLGSTLDKKKKLFVKKIRIDVGISSTTILNNCFFFVSNTWGVTSTYDLTQLNNDKFMEIGYRNTNFSENALLVTSVDDKSEYKMFTESTDYSIKMSNIVNTIPIKGKSFVNIFNSRIKKFFSDFFKGGVKYSKITKEEVDNIYENIRKESVLEFFKNKKREEDNQIERFENQYGFDKKTVFFQDGGGDFYIGQISSNGDSKFIKEGKGCEFVYSEKDDNYQLFYHGNYKNGERGGEGKVFFSDGYDMKCVFKDGDINFSKHFSKFNEGIVKRAKDYFNIEFFEDLFEKKTKFGELKEFHKFRIIRNNWENDLKSLVDKFFGIKEIMEFRRKMRKLKSYESIVRLRPPSLMEYWDKEFFFGFTNISWRPDVFGITFIQEKGKFKIRYIGEIKKGIREGRGIEYDTENMEEIYEGYFKDGKKDGKGAEYEYNKKDRRNELIFEGIFKNGERNGEGRLHKEGECIKGEWKDGKMIKESETFSLPRISYYDVKEYLNEGNYIGSGAYGNIYRVKGSKLKNKGIESIIGKKMPKYFAVKIMCKKVRSLSDPEIEVFANRVKGIIKVCQKLQDSTNICKVVAFFNTVTKFAVNKIGYVMEYCSTSLERIIKGMKEDKKLYMLWGVARGMYYLHEKEVMHRDLKWSNVLLDKNGVVKLADFDTMKEDISRITLTDYIGTMTSKIGTQGYKAPEVHSKYEKYNLPCDVYSFGIMIYSILFELNQSYRSQIQCNCGEKVETLLERNVLEEHVGKCDLRPYLDAEKIAEFPEFLIDLMILCWQKDPSKRPTFEEIFQILDCEKKKLKNRSYFLIDLEFPKHKEYFNEDKLLLLQKDEKEFHKKIINYLTTGKYKGCEINNLGGIKNNDDILDLLDLEEKKNKKKRSGIEVEFSKFIKISLLFPEHEDYFNNDEIFLLRKDGVFFYRKIVDYLTTGEYKGCKIGNLDCVYGEDDSKYNSQILELLENNDNLEVKVVFSEVQKKKIGASKILENERVRKLKTELKSVSNERDELRRYLRRKGLLGEFSVGFSEESEGEGDDNE